MRFNYLFFFILLGFISLAQKKETQEVSFKNLQQQYHDYVKSHDASQEKQLKNFKRWEYNMQLHTNTNGEPAGFATYIDAALEMAEFKNNLFKSGAASAWTPLGPNILPENLTGYMENGIGRINCLAFHPTDSNTFFAGVAQGGLWKTSDNGVSWTPLTDNLPITRISDICIDPLNPDIMYISVCDYEYIGKGLFLTGHKRHTHYGLGIYKTTDGGISWNPTGLTFQLTDGEGSLIKEILLNPNNTNEILACGVNGMYKSFDGGNNWIKKLDSLFCDMVQDPINPSIIYAATAWIASTSMGNAAIYKSVDFGETWVKLNTNMPSTGQIQRIKLAIAPSDPNYIYAICGDNSAGFSSGYYGMYKSSDAGVTWIFHQTIENILGWGSPPWGGQATYDLALLVDPSNKTRLYAGGVNLWCSINGGYTYTPVSHWTTYYGKTLHGDIHALEYHPITKQYYACTDGGLYRTRDIVFGYWGLTDWEKLNNGMQITSFYKLSVSKNSTERLCAGSQDNATFYFKNNNWTTIYGGDGMDNYLDPLNDNKVVCSSQYGNFGLSNSNGQAFTKLITNPNKEESEWVTPIAADYKNPGVLYIGHENVVKSTDGGNTWTALPFMPSGDDQEISALAVSQTNSLVIFAAKRVRYEKNKKAIVFKTTNGGQTWIDITAGLPDNLYYTGIEINEKDANTAYVCMAGFSTGNKVYTTVDGGVNWTNITYNLPDIPVNCVKQIPGSDDLIAGTDIGVYTLAKGSVRWVNISFGLPNVIVSDIEFNPVLNKVYLATFGRGIWEASASSIGIAEVKNKLVQFNLFPSINKGEFSLKFDNNDEKTIEVIDVMGKVVYLLQTKQNYINISLNVSSGAYYLRTTSKNKTGVKKFIIQ